MASQLKVDTITGVTTAGSIVVTGEGNSTTTNLQQGLAKSLLNYNQTGPTTDDSFNISSVSDDTTGTFTPAYTNVFSNVNYSCSGMCNTTMFVCLEDSVTETSETTTSDAKMLAMQHNGTLIDCEQTMVKWHGDLA